MKGSETEAEQRVWGVFNVFRRVERSLGPNPQAVPTDDSSSKGKSINNSHMRRPSGVFTSVSAYAEWHCVGCRDILISMIRGRRGGGVMWPDTRVNERITDRKKKNSQSKKNT